MEKTTQWRYTPPTHVVVAFARRSTQLRRRRRPAGAPRPLYAQLRDARRAAWPSSAFVRSSIRDPGADHRDVSRAGRSRATASASSTTRARKGLHPVSRQAHAVETFRVGCIGAIGPEEMRHAVNAVRDTLRKWRSSALRRWRRPARPRDSVAGSTDIERRSMGAAVAGERQRGRSRAGRARLRRAEQAIEHDEARVGGHFVRAAAQRAIMRAAAGEIDETMLDASPSWLAGMKSARQPQVVDEDVSRCRPSAAIGRSTCTAPAGRCVARKRRRRCRLLPMLP